MGWRSITQQHFFFLFTLFWRCNMSGKCFPSSFQNDKLHWNFPFLGGKRFRWYPISPFLQCAKCCNATIQKPIFWFSTCVEMIGGDGSTCDRLIRFHFCYLILYVVNGRLQLVGTIYSLRFFSIRHRFVCIIFHHSMTLIANHNDVTYWNYTGERKFKVSLGIMSH